MDVKKKLVETLLAQKILPLFFHDETDSCWEVLKALYAAGIRMVEFTNRGESALATFRHLAERCAEQLPDLYLGAGTIKNIEQAEGFRVAGAQFLISPGYVPELAAFSVKENLLYIPGCMTIHEIIAAENAGIRLIKVFPANMLGTIFLKNIRPLFPNLMFMPTGGIDATKEALDCWRQSGAVAVGLGGSLISERCLAGQDYAAITATAKGIV